MPDGQARPPDLVVKVSDAKARLSELIARAERGERVVIARGDQPVVTLEVVAPTLNEWASVLDVLPGLDVEAALVAAEEPYTEEELDAFQGELDEEMRGA